MRKSKLEKFSQIDFVLLSSVLALVIIGLVFVYSASSYKAEQAYGNSAHYLIQQIARVMVGLIMMIFVAMIDFKRWLQWAPIFYALSVFLLVLLFLPLPIVATIKGASRWLRVGPITIQPSDFARYALVLVLARVLVSERRYLEDLNSFIKLLILVGAVVLLIALEPDLGTAMLTIFIAFGMFFFAEINGGFLLATILSSFSLGLVYILRNGYQLSRVHYFVNQFTEREFSWQVKQGLISFTQGGLLGKGLGSGQQKYDFLPEAHKDFILCVIGEEIGFIGTGLVLGLFLLVIIRGFRIARQAPNGYGQLLAAGISLAIGLYAFMNAAVVLAIVPTTGIPLPFISYGGSAMVTNLAAVGILLNISMQGSAAYERQVGWRTMQSRLKRPAFS